MEDHEVEEATRGTNTNDKSQISYHLFNNEFEKYNRTGILNIKLLLN